MTARQLLEQWLVTTIRSDAVIEATFAAEEATFVVRNGVALLGETASPILGRNQSRRREGIFVEFALFGGTFEAERCGPWQEGRLSYMVKCVGPGDSSRAVRTIAERLEAILSGASHQVPTGVTADTTSVTADTILLTADNAVNGARWLLRLAEPVAYSEPADPHRYIHEGGVYSVHLVA